MADLTLCTSLWGALWRFWLRLRTRLKTAYTLSLEAENQALRSQVQRLQRQLQQRRAGL